MRKRGVTGRDRHEHTRVEEPREPGLRSVLPCASQSPSVIGRVNVVETIIARLSGHLLEAAPSFFAFAVAISEHVVEPQPAVPGLAQTLKRKLMLVKQPNQSVPADPQERGRLLGRELAIDRFKTD